MIALKPEYAAMIEAGSGEEKSAMLEYLALDAISKNGLEIRSITNSMNQTVGYLVPNHPSPAWKTVFSDPASIEEIHNRIINPGPSLTLEELMVELEND